MSLIAALALAVPSVASAQSSLESGYDPQSGESQAGVSRDDEGALPFTGSNLYVWAGLGLVLLGTGVALRRAAEPHAATARGGRRAFSGLTLVPARRRRPERRADDRSTEPLEPTESAFDDS